MQHKREWYIPQNAFKVEDKHSDAVFYIATAKTPRANGRNLDAIAFHGRAQKPDWHYMFRTREELERSVTRFCESRRAHSKAKAEWRAKQNKSRKLEVGHILYTCWGYDQTNTEYFEVTKLVGKCMVELREISCVSTEDGGPSASVIPQSGKYIGEPIRRRVKAYDGTSVKICGVRTAWLWNGKPKTITGAMFGH